MALWGSLRVDLRDLLDDAPGALRGFPDPDSERSADERISVELAAWASDIAASLHEKYGDQIDLRVGAMPFPNTGYRPDPRLTQLHGSPAASVGLALELAAPLTVRTGRSTTARAQVANHSTDARVLMTNGHLQAVVIDADGAVVGRYTGAQTLALVMFTVEPDERREVPVLVGTDSVVPELGYAVPPGSWSIVVEIPTAGHVVSSPLPCVVTT
jgi:hypothetical protein